MAASSAPEPSPKPKGGIGSTALAALPAAASVALAVFSDRAGLGALPAWAIAGAGVLASAAAAVTLRPRHPGEPAPALAIAPPAAAPDPRVDTAALMERLGYDRELLGELVELFELDTPHRLISLREAVSSGDTDAVARAAHGIKSGLSNFCAHSAQERAFTLELAGREGVLPSDAAAQVDALEACLDQVVILLTALSAERAA